MSFISSAQLIVSSNILEFDSNDESIPNENSRQSISPQTTKVSINNVGQAMPWRTLSIASAVDYEQERNTPRFTLRSIKKNQNEKKNYQPSITIESEESQPILKPTQQKQINLSHIIKLVSYAVMFSSAFIAFLVGIDQTIRPPNIWGWSGQRNLKGRHCVLNFFIDKHSRDEYDPDFGAEDFGHKGGTYWTPGKFKVITRFISSVSGTFRHKIHVKQHLIFAGVRDGGYLAQKAFESWPKRGSKFSEIHIIAADVKNNTDTLEYSYLDEIENRFHGTQNVHIYDRNGLAGTKEDIVDDDGLQGVMSTFEESHALRNNKQISRLPYPKLSSFIQVASDGDVGDTELVIPYLHVDGVHMEDQLEILMSAVPLLKSKTIVSVGIEHSQDMNVLKLIKFFDSVEYKTFFLGSRQLARIDNLCPETLNDVLAHPFIDPVPPTWSSMLLNKLGLRQKEAKSASGYKTPPFFVAFPRGRINREEMSIQHAYDLFGGIDGEKNVKTANDRINK